MFRALGLQGVRALGLRLQGLWFRGLDFAAGVRRRRKNL